MEIALMASRTVLFALLKASAKVTTSLFSSASVSTTADQQEINDYVLLHDDVDVLLVEG